MSTRKLWHVYLSREQEMDLVVEAEDAEEAALVAQDSAQDAWEQPDFGDDWIGGAPRELAPDDPLPGDWDEASIPWGGEGMDTIRDIREQQLAPREPGEPIPDLPGQKTMYREAES